MYLISTATLLLVLNLAHRHLYLRVDLKAQCKAYLISAIFNRIIRHYLLLCLVSLNFIRFIENVNRLHGVFGTVFSEAQDCNDWSHGWHCNRMSNPGGDFEWNQNTLKRTEPACVINNTTTLICAQEWTCSSMHSCLRAKWRSVLSFTSKPL